MTENKNVELVEVPELTQRDKVDTYIPVSYTHLPGVTERFGPAQHVGVSLNGRQRRAELVRGVRNEGANLMFGPLSYLQRRVHVIQQLVEGVAHRANLGARVRIAGLHAHGR